MSKIDYVQRFSEAVELITGVTPPRSLVEDWVFRHERPDDLQQWVGGCGSNTPWWTQNIAILDAAAALAENPIEGENEKIDYSVPYFSSPDL